MKFVQVADGQQFEYQGKTYTKKGPLMAVDDTGSSKLLPRSAVVKLLTGIAPPPASDKNRSIKVEQVIDAFETFYGQCQSLLQDTGTGESVAAQSVLENARQEFMQRLKQGG